MQRDITQQLKQQKYTLRQYRKHIYREAIHLNTKTIKLLHQEHYEQEPADIQEKDFIKEE